MSEAIVITPVKDSPGTTIKTIEAICSAEGRFDYYVFNDFSKPETKKLLNEATRKWSFTLIHLEDLTRSPSPNYKLVLEKAQQWALEKEKPLIIVESDVIVRKDTFRQLLSIMKSANTPGLVGAITTDNKGNYNFPYNFVRQKSDETVNTSHSLSFCCTLLSHPFLKTFDFGELSQKKDWYDVTISRMAKKRGFTNYLAKGVEVIHLPHSSRPWKNLKYNNPVLYYLRKLLQKRDRI